MQQQRAQQQPPEQQQSKWPNREAMARNAAGTAANTAGNAAARSEQEPQLARVILSQQAHRILMKLE